MSAVQDGDSRGRPAAGPVAGQGSPAHPPETPDPAPPAEGAGQKATQGSEARVVAQGDELERDIAALLSDTQRERDEYLDLAKRTKADFENYRKRMAAEVQAAGLRGKADVAREVIDAVDNLERALEAAEEDEAGLADGVRMVLDGLREMLSRNGIEAVDPQGEKFDPNLHEAISTISVEGTEAGQVVEVLQKGYRLGDQLIRPARVVVSE